MNIDWHMDRDVTYFCELTSCSMSDAERFLEMASYDVSVALDLYYGRDNVFGGSQLAELYRSPTEIIFHGTLDEAKENGSAMKRWLLVDYHDPTEFACQCLNRDVWSDGTVQAVVEAGFLFMQMTAERANGQQYKAFYPLTAHSDGSVLPHVAVLDPRTGERMWQLPRESFISGMAMATHLTDYLETHTLEEKQHPVASLVAYKMPEPKDGVRVQLRLPDGSRIIRRFDPLSTVRDIFCTVKALPEYQTILFTITHLNKDLSTQFDETIAEAKLANASLTVSIDNRHNIKEK